MPKFELDMQAVSDLRDLFSTHNVLPESLRMLDYQLGKVLGVDPYVSYESLLFPHRDRLIQHDGSFDLNGAEEVLAAYGEHDLNMAERVLAGFRGPVGAKTR